jgi:hypothetical protein
MICRLQMCRNKIKKFVFHHANDWNHFQSYKPISKKGNEFFKKKIYFILQPSLVDYLNRSSELTTRPSPVFDTGGRGRLKSQPFGASLSRPLRYEYPVCNLYLKVEVLVVFLWSLTADDDYCWSTIPRSNISIVIGRHVKRSSYTTVVAL